MTRLDQRHSGYFIRKIHNLRKYRKGVRKHTNRGRCCSHTSVREINKKIKMCKQYLYFCYLADSFDLLRKLDRENENKCIGYTAQAVKS